MGFEKFWRNIKRYVLHFKRDPIKHTSQAKPKGSLCSSYCPSSSVFKRDLFHKRSVKRFVKRFSKRFVKRFVEASSSPAVQRVGASRVERRSPRFAAAVAVVLAAAAVPGELFDVEAFNEESSGVLASISMSSASRRSELDVVAVFPPSTSPSLFAEVDASLSFSSMTLMRLYTSLMSANRRGGVLSVHARQACRPAECERDDSAAATPVREADNSPSCASCTCDCCSREDRSSTGKQPREHPACRASVPYP